MYCKSEHLSGYKTEISRSKQPENIVRDAIEDDIFNEIDQ